MASPWHWKAKDGSMSGLLYEPGNWGDLLKLLWLTAILEWREARAPCSYFDPFAGAAGYLLGRGSARRFAAVGVPNAVARLCRPALDQGLWPSAASIARGIIRGGAAVYDADVGRRESWRCVEGVTVLSGESGWELLRDRQPEAEAVWLVDPYDILAEWRQWLGTILDQAFTTTILVYIYNRSAGSPEAFREYRAFKNTVADGRRGLPYRWGRAAADGFLPRAHHEMLFLPGRADSERGLERISALLEALTTGLDEAITRSGLYDGAD